VMEYSLITRRSYEVKFLIFMLLIVFDRIETVARVHAYHLESFNNALLFVIS
jgi:hypothetical protein